MTQPFQLPALTLECPSVWESLVDQTAKAVSKAGFTDVVIGLSGGLDSSATAVIAVDAFGAEHVHGVLMPSPYSSQGSITDTLTLASQLGIQTDLIPITPVFDAFKAALAPVFQDCETDITEENLQARIRGTLLMALSNKFGYFVLATGNKSEALAGYATLYGDMVGSYDPVGALYKTHLYELCRWRNSTSSHLLIPIEVLEKEPSAELSPGQLDRHALPPYEVLDAIYYLYVDKGVSRADLVDGGFSEEEVENAIRRMDASVFKRQYAAPIPKLHIYQS